MLGTYGSDPAAATFYAGPLAITGLAVLALWLYATIDHRLVRRGLPAVIIREQAKRCAVVSIVFAASMLIAQVSATIAEFSWLSLPVVLSGVRFGYLRHPPT